MSYIDKYRSEHKVRYEKPSGNYGYSSIPVLEFLKGHKCDDIVLAYISALKPDSIRVSTGCVTCDACSGRITVMVDDDDCVTSIEQEVTVWLPDGVTHGHALDVALKQGLNSEKCRWHLDAEAYSYCAEGYFKRVGDKWVVYPK